MNFPNPTCARKLWCFLVLPAMLLALLIYYYQSGSTLKSNSGNTSTHKVSSKQSESTTQTIVSLQNDVIKNVVPSFPNISRSKGHFINDSNAGQVGVNLMKTNQSFPAQGKDQIDKLRRNSTDTIQTESSSSHFHKQIPNQVDAKHGRRLSFADMVNQLDKNEKIATYSHWITEEHMQNFSANLPPLLADYRNPCWIESLSPNQTYRNSYYYKWDCMEKDAVYKSLSWSSFANYNHRKAGQHWRMRCFPNFFLIGFAKSGTTDLYYMITRNIKGVISGARKEPHFWNRRRFGITRSGSCVNKKGRAARLSDYLDLYDEAAEKMRLRYIKESFHHHYITGDFTPSTVYSTPNWWTYKGNIGEKEPRYTIADHLYHINPHSKLIVILRDPVERAFSQMKYRSMPADGHIAAAFDKLVVETLSRIHQCTNIRACIYNITNPASADYLVNHVIAPGLYSIFIADWLKVFPREQFLFLKFEEYTQNRTREVEKVARFLDTVTKETSQKVIELNKYVKNNGINTEDMWNTTRQRLRKFYKPWNEKLAKLLKDEKFNWQY